MMNKSQLFTLDLLLALIPLTIVLGLSASAMQGMISDIQRTSLEIDATRASYDATEYLLKKALAFGVDSYDIAYGDAEWIKFKEKAVTLLSGLPNRSAYIIQNSSVNLSRLAMSLGGRPYNLSILSLDGNLMPLYRHWISSPYYFNLEWGDPSNYSNVYYAQVPCLVAYYQHYEQTPDLDSPWFYGRIILNFSFQDGYDSRIVVTNLPERIERIRMVNLTPGIDNVTLFLNRYFLYSGEAPENGEINYSNYSIPGEIDLTSLALPSIKPEANLLWIRAHGNGNATLEIDIRSDEIWCHRQVKLKKGVLKLEVWY